MPGLAYFAGLHHPAAAYNGRGLVGVRPGDVVEVDDTTAESLVRDFPQSFRYSDRQLRAGGSPLASASFSVSDLVDLTLRDLREALMSGAYDDVLDDIQAAEKAGSDRHGAHRLIDARRG